MGTGIIVFFNINSYFYSARMIHLKWTVKVLLPINVEKNQINAFLMNFIFKEPLKYTHTHIYINIYLKSFTHYIWKKVISVYNNNSAINEQIKMCKITELFCSVALGSSRVWKWFCGGRRGVWLWKPSREWSYINIMITLIWHCLCNLFFFLCLSAGVC